MFTVPSKALEETLIGHQITQYSLNHWDEC